MKYVIITAALLGAIALAIAALPGGEDARPVQEEATSGGKAEHDGLRVRALEHRVAAMNRRQSALDDELAQVRATLDQPEAAPEHARPPAGGDPGAASEAGRGEQIERAIVQITDTMETSLDREVRDPTWAQDTEAEISRFLDHDAYQGVALEDAECRSAMCRVAMRFEGEQELRYFIEKALNEHPWKYNAQMVPRSPDDMLSVNLYIARQGHALPRP